MSERYTNVRDTLVNEIQAIARSFKGNDQGTRLTAQLRDQVMCPAGLDNGNDLEVFYREVLFQSKMIVTDPKTIREQTKNGFEKLLGNIKNIYLASYHGPCWGSAGNMDMYYSNAGNKLPVSGNTLGLHNRKEWAEWKAKGAISYGHGWIYFKGFKGLSASQCFEHGHTEHIRKKQDEILANAFRMETKRFYAGHHGFDSLYVSKKDNTDYSKPMNFTLPSRQTLGFAVNKAMAELKKRGVVN